MTVSNPAARRGPLLSRSAARDGAVFALGLLGCVLMIIAAYHFRPEAPSDLLDDGVGWMVLGIVALIAALAFSRRPLPPAMTPVAAPLDVAGSRWRWFWLTHGIVLLALDAAISGRLVGLTATAVAPTLQFAVLSLGVIAVTRGLGGPFRRIRFDPKTALPLVAILLLALVLRLVGLGDTIRTLVDEVHWINGVQHLWWHPSDGLLTAGSTYLPTTLVYSYWEASAVTLFGRNLFGLRLTSAMIGTLNIWALYLLARALFDRTTALVAALVLATFPPHLHFSRIAMAHVGDTLFGTLALAFAARGLRDNRRLDWALCGVTLGSTQYFYEGGRLLFPPLLVLWLALLIVTMRGHLRAQWRGIGVALVTALIVAAPVYIVIAAQHSPITNRMNDAGLGLDYWLRFLSGPLSAKEQGDLILRLTVPFQIYVHLPELAVYYGGKTALILTAFVPLALLGVAYTLWRWRTPAVVVLLWVIATAVGNIMLRDNGQDPRFVVVFPALALLVTLGARSALGLLTQRAPAPVRLGLLVALVAVIGVVQVGYYFFVHLPLYNVQIREAKLYPDGTDAVLRSLALPADTQIVLISDPTADENVPRTLLGFLTTPSPNAPLVSKNVAEVTGDYLMGLPRDHNYAFFVQPGYPLVVERIRAIFPVGAAQISPYADVPPDRTFILYYAPRTRP